MYSKNLLLLLLSCASVWAVIPEETKEKRPIWYITCGDVYDSDSDEEYTVYSESMLVTGRLPRPEPKSNRTLELCADKSTEQRLTKKTQEDQKAGSFRKNITTMAAIGFGLAGCRAIYKWYNA